MGEMLGRRTGKRPAGAPVRTGLATLAVALVSALAAACDLDLFGPDTPTTRSTVRGVVTAVTDGTPIEGAQVFSRAVGWVVTSGDRPAIDTVRTDPAGRYTLDTEHFCPSRVVAQASGYLAVETSRTLTCPGTDTITLDFRLPPAAWGFEDLDPAWDPTGRWIAVSSNRPSARGFAHIHLLDSLGSAVGLPTALPWTPTWSPDGERIASHNFFNIGVVKPDGSEGTVPIQDWPVGIGGVAWSPAADVIAFWETVEGRRIHLLDLETGATTPLPATGVHTAVSWSPDGGRMVFDRFDADAPSQLYVMDADGSGVTPLTDLASGAFDPAWAPCDRIVFSAPVADRRAILVMEADGSEVTVLTDGDGRDIDPVWAPDCSSIAFASDREERVETAWSIWIVNADGSGLRPFVPEGW